MIGRRIIRGTPEETALYYQAVKVHGENAQMAHCIEEAAEFILAMAKVDRHKALSLSKVYENLVEEIADLTIMMRQARILVGEDRVDEWIEKKLHRLAEELDAEKPKEEE